MAKLNPMWPEEYNAKYEYKKKSHPQEENKVKRG